MKLSNLAKVLRAAGLTVVEMPGWATRGYEGQDLAGVRGILWHHTATNRAAYAKSNAPTVQMTMNGRSDLAGPLCNITFGRDGTVYLVAAGLANHAGKGIAPGIPRNTGNYYLIGIEMESSGIAPWDWTEDQIRVAPYLGAALELAYLQGIPEEDRLQLGHKEYSSEGKIDPAGWPGDMDGLRAAINAVLNGSAAIAPQGTTVKPTPAVKKESEVPKYTRVSTPPVKRRLAKDKPITLVTDASNAKTLNLAVLGLGHYDVDLFLNGSGLPAGETLTVQFAVIPTGGKSSGYFREEIHGSADGTFSGRARFKGPILAASRLEVTVVSSREDAYLEGAAADVYAWADAK